MTSIKLSITRGRRPALDPGMPYGPIPTGPPRKRAKLSFANVWRFVAGRPRTEQPKKYRVAAGSARWKASFSTKFVLKRRMEWMGFLAWVVTGNHLDYDNRTVALYSSLRTRIISGFNGHCSSKVSKQADDFLRQLDVGR